MRVNVVALLHILQYLVVVGLHALAFQLVVAALGTHLGTGCHENLQLGMREYYCANVASVHDHTASAAHLLLLCHHSLADKAQRGNRTDVAGDLHRADVLFYQLAVEVGVWSAGLGVKLKGYVDVGQLLAQSCLVDAVGGEQPVAEGIEGDAAVHGTCVDVYIAYLACKVLGHRTLTAR